MVRSALFLRGLAGWLREAEGTMGSLMSDV